MQDTRKLKHPLAIAARWLAALGGAGLLAAVLATPAAALPVTYTMEGTLTAIGEDLLDLDGARLVIVAIADTEDSPIFTTSSSSVATATYAPHFDLIARFSDRPGGALDVELAYTSQLQALNRITGATADGLMLFEAPATFEGTAVAMPAFSVFFLDQAFFPGTGTPPLPLFAPGDVATVAAGFVGFDQGAYTLGNRAFRAVPEAEASLMIALCVGLMAAAGATARR